MILAPPPKWLPPEQKLRKRIAVRIHNQIGLTVSLVILIGLAPLLSEPGLPRLFLSLLTTSVILAGVYAVSWNSARLAIGLMLALPAVVTFWSDWLRDTPILEAMSISCQILFFSYTLETILQYVFRSSRITTNELFGAINAYILFGITFGLIYLLLELLRPGSFHITGEGPIDGALAYYSFSTLATLGIGDVLPKSPFARSLTVIEVLIGVLYVAILIGHLVSHRRNAAGVHIERISSGSPASYLVARRIVLPFRYVPLLILGTAVCNYGSSVWAVSLNMPFYLDSWATSLGAILGGLGVGIAGGVLYNVAMALTYWDAQSVVWSCSSTFVATATWYFWHRGWINIHRPVELALAGSSIGTLNSLLVITIQTTIHTKEILDTTALRQDLFSLVHNEAAAKYGEQILVEVIDKTVSLASAAIVLFVIGEVVCRFHNRKRATT